LIPDEVTGFFQLTQPFPPQYGPGVDQPLTEMITRNHLGGKGRPARGADDITAIWEQIV
jgi:hypothetical protein